MLNARHVAKAKKEGKNLELFYLNQIANRFIILKNEVSPR